MNDEHSVGSGQPNQRGNYSRPFFYVQPASPPYHQQPYHHWHLNNPYYGQPAGYPYGRPYMSPYPYMQFPGYVVPHAPVHPMDYRRLFEPHIYPPPGQDGMFRHQHHQHPASFRREMACSEAQTDPSDALNKIIESLEKLRANEIEKELDSGVASQTSGIFSSGDEKKRRVEEEEEEEETAAACSTLEGDQLRIPAMAFSDSTKTIYDAESARSRLPDLGHQECWPHNSDEELPLDSSSIHEENRNPQEHEEDKPVYHCPPEKLRLSTAKSETLRLQDTDSQLDSGRATPEARSKTKGPLTQSHQISLSSPMSVSTYPSNWQESNHEQLTDHMSKTNNPRESTGVRHLPDGDLTYQILKLPFEEVLATGALQRDSSLLSAQPQAVLPSSCISSPSHPFYPSYWPPHNAHERMSILSPSVDELSSRDEMFSTDLDDMDLFPKHEYTSRRLTEVVEGLTPTTGEVVWPVCPKRLLCACCGMSLSKQTRKGKGHGPGTYGDDEEGDSDEECKFGRWSEHPARLATRKHSKKSHPSSRRLVSKEMRGHGPEVPATADQQVALELFKGPEGGNEEDACDAPYRTCQAAAHNVDRWECQEVQPKRKTQALPQGQERLVHKKATCKPLSLYHRSHEDNDEEPPRCHRVKRIPQ